MRLRMQEKVNTYNGEKTPQKAEMLSAVSFVSVGRGLATAVCFFNLCRNEFCILQCKRVDDGIDPYMIFIFL